MASLICTYRIRSSTILLLISCILVVHKVNCGTRSTSSAIFAQNGNLRADSFQEFTPNLFYNGDYMAGNRQPVFHSRESGAIGGSLHVCTTWGASTYRTFDNFLYSFEGTCAYTLLHDYISDGFRISVINNGDCYPQYKAGGCVREIVITPDAGDPYHIKYENSTSTLPQVFSNNRKLDVPGSDGYLVFNRVTHWLVVTSTQGYILKFDGMQTITIHIDSKWKNGIRGLCGTFDDDPTNDLTSPDGSSYSDTDIEQFASSWENENLIPQNQTCLTTAKATNFSMTSTDAARENAHVSCEKILGNDCSPYVDQYLWYYNWCKNEYLGCADGGTCNCDTLSEYHRQCFRNGRQPFDWGGPSSCSTNKKCTEDKAYNECGSLCLKTCTNRDQTACPGDHCVEGCLCPPDNVLNSQGVCIPIETCPCEHQGMEYDNGETLKIGCESCTCEKGYWKCHRNQCGARCSQITDVHYETFDGKAFDFTGECYYTMVQSSELVVAMEKSGCSSMFSHSTLSTDPLTGKTYCNKKIYITVTNEDDSVDTIMLLPGKEILLNNNIVMSLPYSYRDVVIDEDFSEVEVFLRSSNVRILWDGDNHMHIDVPDSFINKTQGLCGTYTNNQDDDFLTPAGDYEVDAYNFANKWKIPPSHGQCGVVAKIDAHPCSINTEMKMEDAEKVCNKLLDMEVFSVCHSAVNPDSYVEACLYDMCSCRTEGPECMCSIFSAYVTACNRENILIDWRNEINECGLHCAGDQVWSPCANPCIDTCMTIAGFQECEDRCYEGCSCPKGETLNAIGKCVPVNECPCIHENKEYESGYRQLRGMRYCECKDAVWDCHIATNNELNDLVANEMCPSADNKEDTDCRPKCPDTCANKDTEGPSCVEEAGIQQDMCIAGCQCKTGYIFDESSNRCVFAFNCPCFHGGQRYEPGDSILNDCNECVCNAGNWQCDDKECPAECSAWGLEHYSTFDGKKYDFVGDCAYTLAKGEIDNYLNFEVTIQNYPCSTTGMTCTKYISVKTGGGEVILRENDSIPKTLQYGVPLVVRDIGLYVYIKTDVGLSVLWDKGSRVYVRLQPLWKNQQVQGLCGNYDDDQSNDFMGPMGGFALPLASTFADEWKSFPYCPNAREYVGACSLRPHRKEWAMKACSVFFTDTFSACHGEVDPQHFHTRCVSDSCACDIGGDCGCLCSALAAYAQACNKMGVPLKWRSQSLCPIQCRTCDEYSPCKAVTPPLTCETKDAFPELVWSCDNEPCVEGCVPPKCPKGQIFRDEESLECINEEECPVVPCTMWRGEVVNEGEPILGYRSECEQCFCSKGNVTCTGQPCPTTTPTSTMPYPSTSPICPFGQTYNACAFKCNSTCESLLQELIEANRCEDKDDCIPGCETETCEGSQVWLDIETCVDLNECPCKMDNGTFVAPNKVVFEEECWKCQCTNNTYDCWTPSECITTTPAPICSDPMGCENFEIEDYQFSSTNNEDGYPPSNGRLNYQDGGFIGPDLVIDFMETRNVSGVLIQGFGDSYPKTFTVDIGDTLEDLQRFSFAGDEVIENVPRNGSEVKEYIFDEILEGRFLKVSILSYHNQPGMRIEVIGCYHEYPTTPAPPAPPCPELTAVMEGNCTFPCNVNQSCDGTQCVATKDCPCVKENQKYQVGQMMELTNCDKCICQAGGNSDCSPLECDPCTEGKERNETDTCGCDCMCMEGHRLCPTDDICIPDPEWCDGAQTCTDDETGCPEPDKCEYIGDNIETFDGVDYDYMICNNVLMHDKINDSFSVNIHRECTTTESNACTKYMIIRHNEHLLKLNENLTVEYRGSTYEGKQQVESLTNLNPGFELAYQDSVSIKFKSMQVSEAHFEVTWTKEKNAKIEIQSDMYQKVDGLCGHYDGNATGDLMLTDGSTTTDGTELGDNWEMVGNDAIEECVLPECNSTVQAEATVICTALMVEPLHVCSELLDVQNKYHACISLLCDCATSNNRTLEDCLCDALVPFTRDCQEARNGEPIQGWREKYSCIPECDNTDMTWQECGPLCETTCENYEGTPECDTDCTPGCYCPAGLVLNAAEDKCVEPKECKDCLCSGYGDPHYTTFDGLKYTSVIDCDVFLAKHETSEFSVRGYHGECDEESSMTCLNKVMIEIDEIAYSIIITPTTLAIGTDEWAMADMPYEDENVLVTGTIGETITVFSSSKKLEVTYFAANHGFRVVFPSHIYYNDVAGSCGRCNQDISDEKWLSSESITEDTEEFLESWKIGTDSCTVSAFNYTTDLESVPSTVCNQFMSDAFSKCNPIVDPQPYIDACKRDYVMATMKKPSVCKSLMAYARECCQEGIALDDWTDAVECPQECPDGMEFMVCRKPCLKTCDNYKTFNLNDCPVLPVDGCFCPDQQALVDGVCQDPEICEFCDDEGHKVGDVWEKGPCTTCSCNCSNFVQCLTTECPAEVACNEDENKVEIPMMPTDCCQQHRCVPKCAEANVPQCEVGEKIVTRLDDKDCSYYVCECDPTACAPLEQPLLRAGETTTTVDVGCCQVIEKYCDTDLCPQKLQCDAPFTYEETDGVCCPTMSCLPPPAKCEYTTLLGDVEEYEFGDTWTDGPCKNCTCKNETYNYVTDCVEEQCQDLDSLPDAADFDLEPITSGSECCPAVKRTSCKINNETVGSGSNLNDTTNPCVTYSCAMDDDGQLTKKTLETECNVRCLPFESFVEPEEGICCGGCTPDKCIHEGTNRAINETWTDEADSCKNATCILSEYMTEVVTVDKYGCAPVDTNCPEDMIVPDDDYDGCCLKCAIEPECVMFVIPQNETVGLVSSSDDGVNCTNENEIPNLTYCKGNCGKHCAQESGDFSARCDCCEVNGFEELSITLQCSDGSESSTTIRKAASCICSSETKDDQVAAT